MATLTLNVNDVFVPRIVAAVRNQYPNLTGTLPDGQAVKAVIMALIKDVVVNYEASQAVLPIQQQIRTQADNISSAYDTQAKQTETDFGGNVS